MRNKVLRHVTGAFREDPVRILRVARFAARFADFSVAPETMQLMREMVAHGEAGEDFENSPDAPWDGAGFGGRVRAWF